MDTFGAMDMKDLVHVFKQVNSLLDKNIKIGHEIFNENSSSNSSDNSDNENDVKK